MRSNLRYDIEQVIDRNSAENGSNTPDCILARYLTACLAAFDEAVNARESWYGRVPKPPDAQAAQDLSSTKSRPE